MNPSVRPRLFLSPVDAQLHACGQSPGDRKLQLDWRRRVGQQRDSGSDEHGVDLQVVLVDLVRQLRREVSPTA